MRNLRFLAAIENLAANRADDEMLDVAARIGLLAHFIDGGDRRSLHDGNTKHLRPRTPFANAGPENR
jgi:hypothetical protein